MRSFCDICDVFDLHETEDCPLQSNEDDGGGSKNRGARGMERPYCDSCESMSSLLNKKMNIFLVYGKKRVNKNI